MNPREIQVPITSRMGFTPLLQQRDSADPTRMTNTYYWGIWERPNITDDDSDRFVTLKQQHLGRLDLMAYQFLGDPGFWWVIADVNGITNQFSDDEEDGGMPIGSTIRIPTRERLLSILSKSEGGSAVAQPE